jgi:hypothetical protein
MNFHFTHFSTTQQLIFIVRVVCSICVWVHLFVERWWQAVVRVTEPQYLAAQHTRCGGCRPEPVLANLPAAVLSLSWQTCCCDTPAFILLHSGRGSLTQRRFACVTSGEATAHADSGSDQFAFVRCGKRQLFLRVFPMFVPSLSWQNDRFYI